MPNEVGLGDVVGEAPQLAAVNVVLPVVRSIAADDALERGLDR